LVTIPTELDVNSSIPAIINAALVAGLYPKLLAFDHSKAELRTITNNQAVWIHPSSVNFNRRLSDMGCNYFAYFTLMHSKKLYAWETSPVDDLAILLLCGDSEFKIAANIPLTGTTRSGSVYHLNPMLLSSSFGCNLGTFWPINSGGGFWMRLRPGGKTLQ